MKKNKNEKQRILNHGDFFKEGKLIIIFYQIILIYLIMN